MMLFALLLASAATLGMGVPIFMWRTTLREARDRWLPRAEGTTHLGTGSYRDVDVPRMVAAGPPREVHLAALSSWVLGVMFVPGLLAGLYGLLLIVPGLLSIPGLVLAWRLFFLGAPLLRGDVEAVDRVRAAANLARGLNYVVLTLCGIAAVWIPWSMSLRPVSAVLAAMLFPAAIALYAAISLAQARLLDRAAARIEQEHAERQRLADATRVRVAHDAAPIEYAENFDEHRDATRAATHTD